MHTGGGFVALRMQHRRSGLDGFEEIEDRRQFLIVDVDQFQRFFGDLARLGSYQRDHFADMAHATASHHRLIIDDWTEVGIESGEIVLRY